MINIRSKELINSDVFVREPVDNITKKILNFKAQRIILNGGRGTGRSVVLHNMEDTGLRSSIKTIYDNPNASILFLHEPNNKYDEKFFEHYYELLFSNNILYYIKDNYSTLFEDNFKDDMNEVSSLIDKTNNEIISIVNFQKNKISGSIKNKEISSNILKKLRELLQIEKLNLAVDEFDKANNSSKFFQNMYSKYFDLFDKVIITSDDENIKFKKEKLNENGYKILMLTYCMNEDIVRKIINLRIDHNNSNLTKKDFNYINYKDFYLSDEFLNELPKLNGNIKLIFDVISNLDPYLSYKSEKVFKECTTKTIDERKNYSKRLFETKTKPTLYL